MKSIAIALAVAGLFAPPAAAADFSFDAKSNAIYMDWAIYKGDGPVFAKFLHQHPTAVALVVGTHDHGGDYAAALSIARAVRAHGLETISNGICESACAYIWLAGAPRLTWGAPYPKIHLPGSRLYFSVDSPALYSFFREFGLPTGLADYVVAHADGANNDLTELTPSVMHRFGL